MGDLLYRPKEKRRKKKRRSDSKFHFSRFLFFFFLDASEGQNRKPYSVQKVLVSLFPRTALFNLPNILITSTIIFLLLCIGTRALRNIGLKTTGGAFLRETRTLDLTLGHQQKVSDSYQNRMNKPEKENKKNTSRSRTFENSIFDWRLGFDYTVLVFWEEGGRDLGSRFDDGRLVRWLREIARKSLEEEDGDMIFFQIPGILLCGVGSSFAYLFVAPLF